ncbi:MAG: signal recognition particle protein [Candidatus Eremiobacteraeota bacterium]|nr:signal recognition particle protein [Candidatus Eremiobacteraeota bacterium]MBC5826961.1 signal recognition particle protein [Candidatus Eremiobacteraeota bacterium]
MFESLSDRLGAIFRRLRSRGKLTESDVAEVLREVRIALLEADVNLKVVKDFIGSIRERAVGTDVIESLSPAQAVIKIVRDGLVDLMGAEQAPVRFAPSGPTPILLAGLQGSGKTTHAAKLALLFKNQGRRPLLVACDVHRPAAITQLEVLGEQIGVPVWSAPQKPVAIAAGAMEEARKTGYGAVIVDTAGRLQIDEPLMKELADIKEAIAPLEVLLVVDAMTGQEAVNVAKAFNDRIALTGTILTKLDGDSRGGAALSIRAVTGKPVKFMGTGEKVTALEPFYPDRLVSRILGMGDMLTLIEKTQSVYDEEKAKELAGKFRRQNFSLQDFLDQLRQMRRMGPLSELLKMIPGIGKLAAGSSVDEQEVSRIEAIICSMTPRERADARILNASRRRRIATGSGTRVQDVNAVIKQFEASRQLMKSFARPGKRMPHIPGMTLPRS